MSLFSRIRTLCRSDRGSSFVELAFMLPFLLLLLLATLDFGRVYYLSSEIAGAAHAGAVYASGNRTDTTGIQNAAKADAPDVAGLTASSSYACECSDGTGKSPSCSTTPTCSGSTLVYPVTVSVTATYNVWFPWPGVPSSFPFNKSATMRSGN
jgi:Flp pilus assembly protein TadG